MSTLSRRPASRPRPPSPEPDPFRYGWRYVRIIGPDGTEAFDQVPLTLEDVLHPEVGDFIVRSDPQVSDISYLRNVFRARLQDRPGALVLSDCRVDFNIPGVRPLGPDVVVFFGVKRRIIWATCDVGRERARPVLVVEVTSPDTRSNDVGIKLDYYHRARVPWYLIADAVIEEGGERRIELILYRRTRTGYRRVEPDAHGRVWLEPVGLRLGLKRDPQGGFLRLACFDPVTGQEVGDYSAISRALTDAQDRAEAKAARAEVEAARARAEAEARTQAEARIRELEAALKRSRRRGS